MKPSQLLALVRDIGVVVGIGLLLWLVYQAGKDRVSARDLKALQDQITQQSTIVDSWHQEAQNASQKLSTDMAAINAAAAAPHRPVLLCPPARSQRPVLPAPTGETGGAHPSAGTTFEGVGPDHARDIEPELTAFKQRWEIVLAQCRSVLDQWPSR